MPIKKIILHPLTILTVLCVGVGIYKIATLACVSRDSVTFMQFAENLKTHSGAAIQSSDQHPGYPAIILASEWVLGKLGYDPTLGRRIIAAQTSTLACRTIAICFLFFIFCFFGKRRTALAGTALALLIPVYANNGSEVLSDWPNLMLMSAALFFCLRGLRMKMVMDFVAAGVASGLAYWIRPEGAVFVVIMGFYTLICLFGQKTDRAKLCLCCGVMVLSAAVIAGPYMQYKGALFPKKKVGTFISVSNGLSETTAKTIQNPPLQANVAAAAGAVKPVKAVLHFVEKLFNTIFLLSVPLLGVILYKMKQFRRLSPQDQFLCLFIGLWLGLMIWLYCRHGYMSHRHIMPLVIFGFAWIVKGLHGTALVLGSKRHQLHRNTGILIAVCAAVFVPKLVRPAHADKAAYRQAGLWLNENTPADATLAVFDNRVGFYAERPFVPICENIPSGPGYAVMKTSDEPTGLPKTAIRITTEQPSIDKAIQIYAVGTKENLE